MNLKDIPMKEKAYMARLHETSPEVLDALSYEGSSLINTEVAGNPSTSSETLKRLSTDKIEMVRCNVAFNPNVDSTTLIYLARFDSSYMVKRYAAHNPRLDVSFVLDMKVHEELLGMDFSFLFEGKELELAHSLGQTFQGTLAELKTLVEVTLKALPN